MEETGTTTRRGRGRGRGATATRARGATTRSRGRGRGRGRKAKVVESEDEHSSDHAESAAPETPKEEKAPETEAASVTPPADAAVADEKENEVFPPTIDMDADISQLEAPTFTTISRGPPEPMVRLKWDHKVSLIGEKVWNPMIHSCDLCDKPILIYGRMIPCKHVFCLHCGRAEPYKSCPRCKEKVSRVEQSDLGTVFMCTYGGSRYGNTGCRRTYLSQRDLQAHINHRHVVTDNKSANQRKSSISSETQYGQPTAAGPLTSSQSSTNAHGLPAVTSSSSYYSSFSHHNSMHYSNASRNANYDNSSYKSNSDSTARR